MEALKTKKSTSGELGDLLTAIEITDDDDMKSLSAKHQAQLVKIVKHFNTKLAETEASAVEKATAGEKNKEASRINKFSKENKGMANPDVVAAMQPFYDKGRTLEDSYAMACRALEIDPKTGEAPTADDGKGSKGKKEEKKEAKKKEDKTLLSSARTDLADDDLSDDDDDEGKDKKPLSIDDAIDANINKFIAEKGDPFAED